MIKNGKKKNYNRGFGLVEVVVGVSIIASSIFFVMFVAQISQRVMGDGVSKLKAAFLAEEGIEAVKIMRDDGWQSNITPLQSGASYHLAFNGSGWEATSSPIYIDEIFERTFVAEDVRRDINDDISSSGANDPNTKKITATVSWLGRKGTTTESVSTYITNIFSN